MERGPRSGTAPRTTTLADLVGRALALGAEQQRAAARERGEPPERVRRRRQQKHVERVDEHDEVARVGALGEDRRVAHTWGGDVEWVRESESLGCTTESGGVVPAR
jgi:hypothetical protein